MTEMKTIEELYERIRELKGDPRRFDYTTSGMSKAPNGEFVTYYEHANIVDKLKNDLKTLQAQVNSAYSNGRSEGKQEGADYNMRNN